MPDALKIPVHECFHTWQGEGVHLGRAAYFIRTYGCPIHCPWCDSAGTWHPDYTPDSIVRIPVTKLAEQAAASRPEFVVVTGGEPAVHDLAPLTDALRRSGLRIHLETSGAFAIRGAFDWITVSPKRWKLPLAEALAAADELKIIVDEPGAIAFWHDQLRPYLHPDRPVWLHPEWSRREDPVILHAISDWIKSRRAPYRAGWQLHKVYHVDALDPHSRANVPLGGNPELGY